MVFSTFVKQARAAHAQKPQFFDLSYPRARPNSLDSFEKLIRKTNFGHKRSRRHATSDSGFFSIDKGHYGLYYTIYNHNAGNIKITPANFQKLYEEAQKQQQQKPDDEPSEPPRDQPERFYISTEARETARNARIAVDLQHTALQSSRGRQIRCFSTASRLRLDNKTLVDNSNVDDDINKNNNNAINDFNQGKLDARTSGIPLKAQKDTESPVPVTQEAPIEPVIAANEAQVNVDPLDQVTAQMADLEVSSDPSTASSGSASSESFNSRLLDLQAGKIANLALSTDPAALDAIYPIYQSLKRNDITLPTIELYNAVLKLFSTRLCDNTSNTVANIESRLTNLLTVYSDILGSGIKPNNDTYAIVLETLFSGSWNCIRIVGAVTSTENVVSSAYNKAPEFVKIAVELYSCSSIPREAKSNPDVIKNLCLAATVFPDIISKEVVNLLIQDSSNIQLAPVDFYVAVLGVSKHFVRQKFVDDSKQAYEFINTVFENFKSQENTKGTVNENDVYSVYSTLVQALIFNNNVGVATKFVDDIMLGYREKINANTATRLDKADVSLLMLTYVKGLLGTDVSLLSICDLVDSLNALAYVPELSVDLYNDLILRLVIHLTQQQQQGYEGTFAELYSRLWSYYSYVSIRKDYHELPIYDLTSIALGHPFTGRARDFILSLSIDTADHEKIFMLLKELVLKGHLVRDFTVFRKTISYLYNGAFMGGKLHQHYYGLMWSAIESQAVFYLKDSADSASMHYFVSGIVQFIQIPANVDQTTSEACVEALCNSRIVQTAFDNFHLDADNIYGLMSISRDFIQHSETIAQNSRTLARVAQLLAQLINVLEDTENHYLVVSEEILQFKTNLLQSFKSWIFRMQQQNLPLSLEMVEACRYANMDFESLPATTADASAYSTIPLNFVYQLRVNYNVGALQVIEAFQKGHNFDAETWSLLVLPYFVDDHLLNSNITISEFVQRLLALGTANVNDNLAKVIALDNDKINIEILRYLLKNELKSMDSIYGEILRAFKDSENLYFHELVMRNVDFIIANVAEKKLLIAAYLKALVSHEKYGKVLEFVDASPSFVESLNLESENEVLIIDLVLNSMLETNELGRFNETFRAVFSKKSVDKQHNTLMKDLLIKNCIYNGLFDLICTKFTSKYNSSTPEATVDLLLMNDFMKSLESSEYVSKLKVSTSPYQRALTLLLEKDVKGMVQQYSVDNKAYNQVDIVNEVLNVFVKAATIATHITSNTTDKDHTLMMTNLSSKFHNFLNFLGKVKVNQLSTLQLLKIINFYSLTGQNEMINVLLNKIAYISKDGKFNVVPMLDFYFMKVSLYTCTKNQLITVLDEFRRAFIKTQDKLNTNIIYALSEHYKLKFGEMTII